MRQCASYINARRHRFPDLAGWRTTRLRCTQVVHRFAAAQARLTLCPVVHHFSASGSPDAQQVPYTFTLSSRASVRDPGHTHTGTRARHGSCSASSDSRTGARNAVYGRWMMIQVTASGIPSNLTRSQPPGSLAGYQRIPAGTTGLGTAGLIPRLDRTTNLGTARSCHIAFEMMSRHA